MFEEFMGIPAHPLLLHAAVVFVPLLALVTVAYAFVPFVRAHTRLVLGLLAVVTPLATLFAKLSGDAFLARLEERDRVSPEYVPRLAEHQDLGTMTLYATLVLAVLALALVFVVAPRAAAAVAARGGAGSGGGSGAGSNKIVGLLLGVLALAAAGASMYYVFRTGDTGAKAVWEGQ